MLPILYVDWLSTGDFGPAPRGGEDASGLSAKSVQRLTEASQAEHEAFCRRELRLHRYAYGFAGRHPRQRPAGENDRLALLVLIGVREDGTKELLAVEDGHPGVDRVVGARA